MSLHVESTGSGMPVVFIHGWGMHGGVWQETAQKLSADFSLHCVDLPGYGASLPRPIMNLQTCVESLSVQFNEPVSVCGWSMGGLVAQQWALSDPENVQRLILVASTPCFAERADWPFGMPGDLLEKFATELGQNHAATLRRFIALQLRGSDKERELLATLRGQLFSRGEPDLDALRSGLEILRDTDLRSLLSNIKQPTLVVAGARDKLTPPAASYYMASQIPKARMEEVMGAAHVPFLSHPEIFTNLLKSFLYE